MFNALFESIKQAFGFITSIAEQGLEAARSAISSWFGAGTEAEAQAMKAASEVVSAEQAQFEWSIVPDNLVIPESWFTDTPYNISSEYGYRIKVEMKMADGTVLSDKWVQFNANRRLSKAEIELELGSVMDTFYGEAIVEEYGIQDLEFIHRSVE
jgi:hypothetical protein